MSSKPTLDLNKHWKNLDAIFQASLRKYVLTNNKAKFDELSLELGFDATQSEFLFEAIQTFTMQRIPARNVSLSPYPSSVNGNDVYAIPNNKNKQLKRRRSEIDSSDFDEIEKDKEEEEEEEPEFQTLWDDNDAIMSAKQQDKLEEEGVYVVEQIVNHKKIGDKKYKYNVQWLGYKDLTWEPPEHLNPSLVDEYWSNRGIMNDKTAAILYLSKRKLKPNKQTKKAPPLNVKKEYKCIECDKVFKNGWALGGHNAAKHKKKKPKKDVKMYWEDSDSDDEGDMLVCDDSD
eukprot:1150348_1